MSNTKWSAVYTSVNAIASVYATRSDPPPPGTRPEEERQPGTATPRAATGARPPGTRTGSSRRTPWRRPTGRAARQISRTRRTVWGMSPRCAGEPRRDRRVDDVGDEAGEGDGEEQRPEAPEHRVVAHPEHDRDRERHHEVAQVHEPRDVVVPVRIARVPERVLQPDRRRDAAEDPFVEAELRVDVGDRARGWSASSCRTG